MTKPFDNDVEHWLETLYREKFDYFVRYAETTFRSFGFSCVSRAEDAVQLSFEKAYLQKEKLLTKDSPMAWFYGILKNTVRELYRDDMRWQRNLGKISVLLPTADGTEFILRTELQSMMTDEEFQLLKRLHIDKETYSSLSAEMGITKSALAMRIKRLKERIVREYGE